MPSLQQQTAAANIRHAFLIERMRYAILWARCQSGKTGAYHALITSMLRAGDIQRAYIVCGSAETILRDQAHEDALTHNREHVATGRIQIIFHQDFKSSAMDVTNALIIVDESHLVQTVGQELHTFLGRHGITMDGNPANLIARNTYVVSVDATPYSELAALAHKETPYPKHVEKLAPGEGYRGLDEFFICGNLKATYDITRNRIQFSSLLTSIGPTYALMRLSNGRGGGSAAEATVLELCAAHGWGVLYYTSDRTEIAITRKEQLESRDPIPCLEDAPEVTTVVIIRGRLRAGKVVPKPHIGFVWEGAKSSNTDTIVQGLAGRMCGYHTANPLIFIPAACLEPLRGKVVKDSEIERAIADGPILPRKATNVKKGAVAAAPVAGKTGCVPLRVPWDGSQLADFSGRLSDLKREARALLRRNPRLIVDSDHYTPEQKVEILDALMNDDTPLHGRHMVRDSSEAFASFYKQILEAHRNGTSTSELVAGCPAITYIIAEPGFSGLNFPGARTQDVYVMFYTAAKGKVDRSDVDIRSRIPTTNGKSVFSLNLHAFDRPVAAAGGAGIALEDVRTPVTLEARLREYMTLWRTSALVFSREIVAPDGGTFKLSKRHFHYHGPTDNDVVRICARLETEFGLRRGQLVIKYARSGADMFNLKSISW